MDTTLREKKSQQNSQKKSTPPLLDTDKCYLDPPPMSPERVLVCLPYLSGPCVYCAVLLHRGEFRVSCFTDSERGAESAEIQNMYLPRPPSPLIDAPDWWCLTPSPMSPERTLVCHPFVWCLCVHHFAHVHHSWGWSSWAQRGLGRFVRAVVCLGCHCDVTRIGTTVADRVHVNRNRTRKNKEFGVWSPGKWHHNCQQHCQVSLLVYKHFFENAHNSYNALKQKHAQTQRTCRYGHGTDRQVPGMRAWVRTSKSMARASKRYAHTKVSVNVGLCWL